MSTSKIEGLREILVEGKTYYVSENEGNLFRFSQVIEALRSIPGTTATRKGWNGKGMKVYLVGANSYPVQTQAAKAIFGEGAMVPYNPYFAIINPDKTVSTWVHSANDCLAKDWLINYLQD